MTKISVFGGTDISKVERAVNVFIADKKVIDIKIQSVVCDIGNGCTAIADRIMVIYEEDQE